MKRMREGGGLILTGPPGTKGMDIQVFFYLTGPIGWLNMEQIFFR